MEKADELKAELESSPKLDQATAELSDALAKATKDNKKRCKYRTVFYIVIFKYTKRFYIWDILSIFCELASNVVRPGAFFMLPIVHKTIHVWN